jgi:hypothetical protein
VKFSRARVNGEDPSAVELQPSGSDSRKNAKHVLSDVEGGAKKKRILLSVLTRLIGFSVFTDLARHSFLDAARFW